MIIMNTIHVLLTSIADVKRFVSSANDQLCDIDVISGRYIIDAKSIMGIFSVDLEKPIEVRIHGTEADVAKFCAAIQDKIVDAPTQEN